MTPVVRYAIASLTFLAPSSGAPEITFTDQTDSAGVVFRHMSGGPEKHFIVESHGSGAGFFDADNDGDLDLYAVNGSTFEHWKTGTGPFNALFHNLGDGTFADVSHSSGADDRGWGAGCAVADIDGNGWRDLFITNYGPNVLLRNFSGVFTDLGGSSPVVGDDFSTGAVFFDYDRDGDVDLYVTNYVVFDGERARQGIGKEGLCMFLGGIRVYCGPKGLVGARDVLLRNDGAGGFEDVTDAAGVSSANRYYGLGAVPLDVEGDGDLDLFVANDETPNVLFRNNDDGTFLDIAFVAGVAYNGDGDEEAGMGVDVGDADGDGDDDLYVTNFFRETNTLYRNDSRLDGHDVMFSDLTSRSGLGAATLNLLGWGTRFSDFDGDGDLDLFVANGHVYPQVDDVATGSSYRQRNQVFRNAGAGHYTDVSASAGAGLLVSRVSRGAAFGDYDGDADTDIFINNLDDAPTLLRNDTATGHHWLLVQLHGPPGGDGLGARIGVEGADLVSWRTVNGSASYLSHNDTRTLFGLGERRKVDLVEVRWLDGTRQTIRDVGVDSLLVVRRDGYRLLPLRSDPDAWD